MAIVSYVWVEGNELHYIDESGVERVVVNAQVDHADTDDITAWLG